MSLIKDYLLTQMNNELFDPGIDNLPMPVDGIEPDLEMLTQREQLMEDIDSICDEFFCQNFPNSKEQFDELTRVLCDAVCKNFPTK
tara:strand:+ start:3134 stop:3391 length:258 start_codon:yes stop_codon:yes gene_type:complete